MSLVNIFTGKAQERRGTTPDLIVFHKVTASYKEMINLYPTSKMSVNFIVDTNGTIGYIIPIDKAGYLCETCTNPSLINYYARSRNGVVKSRKMDCNLYAITIDFVCDYDSYDKMPSEQLQSLIWLVNYIRNVINTNYGILIPLNNNYITGYDKIIPETASSINNPGDFIYDKIINSLNVNKNVLLSSSRSSKVSKIVDYGFKVGTKITLMNSKLYPTATSTNVKRIINGTYYLYDGIIMGNRYAVVNAVDHVGKLPSSVYIKGYISVEDVINGSPVIPELTDSIVTSPANTVSVGYDSAFSTSEDGSYHAGKKVILKKTPVYSTPTDTEPFSYKTGTYYLYDGVSNNNRYRITNIITNVGKTPIGDYTVGFIDGIIL